MRYLIFILLLLGCEHEEKKIDPNLITVEFSGGLVEISTGKFYALIPITLTNLNDETIWNCNVYCGFLDSKGDTIAAKNIYFGGMGGGITWMEKYTSIIDNVNYAFGIFDVTYDNKRSGKWEIQ